MAGDPPRDWQLGRFRDYLCLLARVQLGPAGRSPVDASDVAQEALLRAHDRIGQFRGTTDAEFAAWLRQILSTVLVDAVRRHARQGGREQAVGESSAAVEGWLAADHSSPEDRAAREERAARLAAALARLPDDQRTALELKHFQGLSVAEISQQMGRTREAVGGLLRRGLKRLREHLQEHRP